MWFLKEFVSRLFPFQITAQTKKSKTDTLMTVPPDEASLVAGALVGSKQISSWCTWPSLDLVNLIKRYIYFFGTFLILQELTQPIGIDLLYLINSDMLNAKDVVLH